MLSLLTAPWSPDEGVDAANEEEAEKEGSERCEDDPSLTEEIVSAAAAAADGNNGEKKRQKPLHKGKEKHMQRMLIVHAKTSHM
mmetsp:Transcript_14763/g.23437  ORF Transcript_14763/g.23437 Transcript_14763/m.23437 type:complete len:84 (-) Transcript_14763:73-324(-)